MFHLLCLQVKSQQAEVMRILESKNIQFELIDISVGGDLRDTMRSKCGNPTAVPPQIFNDDQYCGVRTLKLAVISSFYLWLFKSCIRITKYTIWTEVVGHP